MSHAVDNESPADGDPPDTTAFFLDGEAPRLAPTTPTKQTVWRSSAAAGISSSPPDTSGAPAPVSLETSSLLTEMSAADIAAMDVESPGGEADAEPKHPMAHLMPTKSIPNEASLRAAEARATRKAKSRKIKIGLIAGMLVFSAVVGPPLGKWLVDAINEAGDTAPVEEPAE